MLSRAADTCFWLSRYIERAENTARILDVNMQLLLDYDTHASDAGKHHWQPLLASLEAQELFAKLFDRIDAETVMQFLTFEKQNPNSIISSICDARENARTIREQISSSMWEHLNRLYLYLQSPSAKSDFLGSPHDFYRRVVEGSHLFQGVTDATMSHSEGWQFIQVGKYVERADNTSRLLDIKYHILLPSGEQVGGVVDLTQWMAVLRSCSAIEAHLKATGGTLTPWNVAEFLILDDAFPRSIRFCVDQMDEGLREIGGGTRGAFRNEVERISGILRSNLDFANIDQVYDCGLHEFLDGIQLQLIEITAAMTKEYCVWLAE